MAKSHSKRAARDLPPGEVTRRACEAQADKLLQEAGFLTKQGRVRRSAPNDDDGVDPNKRFELRIDPLGSVPDETSRDLIRDSIKEEQDRGSPCAESRYSVKQRPKYQRANHRKSLFPHL